MSDFPFEQKIIGEKTMIRKFSKYVEANQLVWHRDREDRFVEVISGKGWSIQLDNKLPQKLTEGSTFAIKAGQYHRILKGENDLKIKIYENQTRQSK